MAVLSPRVCGLAKQCTAPASLAALLCLGHHVPVEAPTWGIGGRRERIASSCTVLTPGAGAGRSAFHPAGRCPVGKGIGVRSALVGASCAFVLLGSGSAWAEAPAVSPMRLEYVRARGAETCPKEPFFRNVVAGHL